MSDQSDSEVSGSPRRSFLGRLSSFIMFGGLTAGYGTLAAFAGRFLFPNAGTPENWQFVATLQQLSEGGTLPFQTPSGAKIVVARQQEGETADCFVALSSVCPHLGCAVHWEPQNERFFCPCHNGAFDVAGRATAGPPAAANQSLTKYPLKVENGLLFISLPSDSLA
ncbi:MAG: Rieske (2Fe-2S) protein [Planctomycetales bacterium]|nr:Rieske (2Fe-2S) protein [Planctomycetales bacterium]